MLQLEILNPEGHPNRTTGSKVTAILLNGWILPIGGASSGEGLLLQPCSRLVFIDFMFRQYSWNGIAAIQGNLL